MGHFINVCSLQLRLASSAPPDFWRRKSSYPWFLPVQTRWKDNDQYLHMNNAVYHAIFDSVINVYLIRWHQSSARTLHDES